MEIDKQARMRRAEELFMQGFNCSQAVVAAFADVYGYTEEQALKMSAGFGAGIGRMRMSCGAFNALALLAGLDCGSVIPGDREGKSYNYKVVQQLAERFRQEHGTLICAELLKLKKGAPLSYEASERTAEYYKLRPCVNQINSAARSYCDYLESKETISPSSVPLMEKE
jgi:C_GCAxxG_C_C family probable redox protein